MVKKLAREDERNPIEVGKIVQVQRQTARIVWIEIKFIDPVENREAYSRICVGLGSGVQSLITFEFWPEDREKAIAVWDTVMESLVLGLFIRDPRTGFALPD
jgi:hypothetical protein